MTTENILAFYRRKSNLTQKELAEKADVSKDTVTRMEKNELHIHNAKYQTLQKLADVLEVKVELFFR